MRGRGVNAEERERKRKLDEEAKRDVMLMGIATFGIMATIGGLMVSRLLATFVIYMQYLLT